MATIAPVTGVDKAVIDLYGNPFYAALATVVETLRHAPYWHVDEKAPARLDRARELVRNSRVLLQDERLASVYGSTKAYDINRLSLHVPAEPERPERLVRTCRRRQTGTHAG